METRVDEIAEGIYRFSTWVPDIGPPDGFTSDTRVAAAARV